MCNDKGPAQGSERHHQPTLWRSSMKVIRRLHAWDTPIELGSKQRSSNVFGHASVVVQCSADLGLMGPGVVPASPPVLILMVLGRAAVGAGQVERVLQLAGRPQDVQRVITQLLQGYAKPDTPASMTAISLICLPWQQA